MNIFAQIKLAMDWQINGQFELAKQAYLDVIAFAPRTADAHHLLGCLYKEVGQTDEGIASISTAISITPQQSIFFNNLGICYGDKKERVVAELCFRHALTLDEKNIDAIANLATMFNETDRAEEALNLLTPALEFAPNHPHILTALCNVYLNLSRYELARQTAQHGLKYAPNDALLNMAKINALSRLNQTEEALKMLDALQPNLASLGISVLKQIGNAQETLGNIEQAQLTYDLALNKDPRDVGLLIARAQCAKVKEDELFFKRLVALDAQQLPMHGFPKTQFHYALGKAYQDTDNMALAAKNYALGAANYLQNVDYDPRVDAQLNEVFINSFDADYLASVAGQGSSSSRPIFVVGMSRSGTTLVEQILASHPLVTAAGELTFISQAVDGMVLPSGWSLNKTADETPPKNASLLERAEYYLKQVDRIVGDQSRPFITDKMPENYQNIGLIHAMFPNARIVHCRRDPIDTCISNYVTLFSTRHYWSYDFSKMATTYQSYWKIMAHWRKVLPGRFLELRYEEVVADTEGAARTLLAWCDLPWDDRVLRFYETNRSVNTASVTQVRQPIYSTSAGRWKKWAPYIAPLLDGIGDIEAAYWAEKT
jgi:tetratricopeptide (TPR) repeat protein